MVALESVTVGLVEPSVPARTTGVTEDGIVLGQGEAQGAAIGDNQVMHIDRASGRRGQEQLAVIVDMDIKSARRGDDHAVDITEAADMQQIADAGAEAEQIGLGDGRYAGDRTVDAARHGRVIEGRVGDGGALHRRDQRWHCRWCRWDW